MLELQILYIVLILFTIIVGTLLSIVLFKIIKILNTLEEIIDIYNKAKQIVNIYSQIPEILLTYFKNTIFWKK